MAEVIVYKSNQIGGCVTVVSAEVNGQIHRIMIDYGSSLDGSDTADDFKELWENAPPEAVFFTHYHGDHVGRLMEIPEDVPIYMGDTARKVMINIQEALIKIPDKTESEIHKQELSLLMDDNRIKTFKWNGKFFDHVELPGFRIEPYSVDHSAYDAYMFLIEAADESKPNGKKIILHTGDFRGHGRRGNRTLDLIKYYVHNNNRKVDVLVTEGTMMSRLTENVMSEPEMQIEAYKYLKQHKYAFLICSSTNLDSLAAFTRRLRVQRFLMEDIYIPIILILRNNSELFLKLQVFFQMYISFTMFISLTQTRNLRPIDGLRLKKN